MKHAIATILSIVLFFCAFSVSAFAEEEPNWKKEYLDYIVEDYSALTQDEKEMTTYQVMYIASDGVPYIYISHGSIAGGGAFCYVDGNKVVTEQSSIIDFEYIERSDAFLITGGRMGSYYDSIYVVNDSGVERLGAGSYGGQYGVPLEEDTGATPINTYTWNDQEVSREEYRREYYGFRDQYLTPEDEVIYTDGYGYGGYSYDEIIAWFMEQGDSSASAVAVSGLYVDSAATTSPCQINFDSKNQTFTLVLTNWYAWEVFDGTYEVDASGVIECVPVSGVSTYYNRVSGSDELNPVHYIISGSGDAIIPVEDGLGEGDCYSRIGEGYSITPDSGSGAVTGDAVRIRCGPGTDYPFFTELYSRNQVSIIGNCGEWCRVECFDSYGNLFRGFIRSDYIFRD